VTEDPQPCRLAGPALGPLLERLLDKDPSRRPDPAAIRTVLRSVAVDPAAAVVLAPAEDLAVMDPHTGGHTVALAPAPSPAPSLLARSLAWTGLCLVIFVVTATAVALARGA